MIRKKLFCILTVSLALTTLRFHGLGNPFALVVGSAIQAFAVPGWLLVYLLHHAAHLQAHGLTVAISGAAAFWFFPVARLRRWFGNFDPFTASDKPRPRILGAAVFFFEQINKRLFGRQKTGGWA